MITFNHESVKSKNSVHILTQRPPNMWNESIPGGRWSGRVEWGKELNWGSIRIKKVSKDDEGEYTCEAKYEEKPPRRKTITLVITPTGMWITLIKYHSMQVIH